MSTPILEITALAIFILCVLEGAHKGLLMKIFSLVRFVLILVMTIVLVPIVQSMVSQDNVAKDGIAYIAAVVVAAIVVNVVANVLKIVDKIPIVKTVNRLGGAILGGCMGVILIWVALAVMGAFQHVEWCQHISNAAKESVILYQIQRFDPMVYILKQIDFPTLF